MTILPRSTSLFAIEMNTEEPQPKKNSESKITSMLLDERVQKGVKCILILFLTRIFISRLFLTKKKN